MGFGTDKHASERRRKARLRVTGAAIALLLPLVCLSAPAHAQSSFFNPDEPPSADQPVIGTAPPVDTGPPLMGDQVCNSLERCLDLLDRHPPDSFDYALLSADLDRFGPPAQAALMERLLSDGEDVAAKNALHALARSRRLLLPAEQRALAEFWVKLPRGSALSITDLTALMARHASPMMRSAAIDTLSDTAPAHARAARIILTRVAAANMTAPLRTGDISRLARALNTDPHPAIIDTLAQNGGVAANPVLARALRSGDAPTTARAYAALYDRDREAAFRALVSTLYGLTDDEQAVALALSTMVQARHTSRKDGFYMNFARDLMGDPEMSAMGRMVGFDARINTLGGQGMTGATPDPLRAKLIYESFTRALSAHQTGGTIPQSYFDIVPILGVDNPDPWLGTLARAVDGAAVSGSGSNLDGQLSLTLLAGQFDSPSARAVVSNALSRPQDYRNYSAALLAAAAQATTPIARDALAPVFTRAGALPIIDIRVAADLARRATASDDPRAALLRLSPKPARSLTRRGEFCDLSPTDFKRRGKAMPYFESGQLPSGKPALRGWLQSADRIHGGWLAGYSASEGDGALLVYDTQSGAARDIGRAILRQGHGVKALVPHSASSLQNPAERFWVITTASGAVNDGIAAAIYRLDMTPSRERLSLAYTLPARPTAIAFGRVGEVALSFGRDHPSVSLTQDGALVSGCVSGGNRAAAAMP